MTSILVRRFGKRHTNASKGRQYVGLMFFMVLTVIVHWNVAQAQPDPYVGEIRMVGFNFAPQGWALCNGQLLLISQNQALFSLLGTTYGGDGQITFSLPDLRGRVPIHQGQGPGLTDRFLGEVGGEETHTLGYGEMPLHTHLLYGDSTYGSSDRPTNLLPAGNAAGVPTYGPNTNVIMNQNAASYAGGNQAHNNMQPYVVINYIIALQGIFPSPANASKGSEKK